MFITEAEARRRLTSTKNLSRFAPANKFLVNQPAEPLVRREESESEPPVQLEPQCEPEPIAKESKPAQASNEAALKLACNLVRQGVPIGTVARELGLKVKDISLAQNAPEIRSSTERTMERIRELALDKLMLSLGLMTPDKYESAALKDLSANAVALAKVIDKTAPLEDRNAAALRLVVYAPQVRSTEHYTVIDV